MIYTDEMVRFMQEFVPGHSRKEINEEFNRMFGTDLPETQTTSFYKRIGCRTGNSGRFQKGIECRWKGKKQTDFMSPDAIERSKKFRFKKGQKPYNYRPVGSERVNIYGYIEIKVKDPNVWEYKHKYVWQQAYGEIPEGHALIFKNRDKSDVSLENIMLVPKTVLGIMGSKGLYSEDPDMTEVGVNYARLLNTIRRANEGNN